MEKLFFLAKGLIIGFSVAAPVGPIGVLCIRRTLARGRFAGLISGLGAASADAIYGAVAGFGLAFVSSFLIRQQIWLRLVGGVFLLCLGIKIFISEPSGEAETESESAVFGDYASTFFLTLANPATILSFAAIFAGLGLGDTGDGYASASMLVFGVFCGSALWWLILSEGVSALHPRLSDGFRAWVNRVSGSVIFAFGIAAISGLFRK